jgi:hypothetical protein
VKTRRRLTMGSARSGGHFVDGRGDGVHRLADDDEGEQADDDAQPGQVARVVVAGDGEVFADLAQ